MLPRFFTYLVESYGDHGMNAVTWKMRIMSSEGSTQNVMNSSDAFSPSLAFFPLETIKITDARYAWSPLKTSIRWNCLAEIGSVALVSKVSQQAGILIAQIAGPVYPPQFTVPNHLIVKKASLFVDERCLWC
jgi:hypothetical protein